MKLFWKTIAALAPGTSAAGADDGLLVFGSWDCEVMAFALDAGTYTVSGRTGLVKGIEKIADDAFGVTLRDDYRFALFDVTVESLTWHSPESGDTFDCRRTG